MCILHPGAPYESSNDTELAAGDRIKVELDPDVWRMLQDGHGGWNEQMAIVSTHQLLYRSVSVY